MPVGDTLIREQVLVTTSCGSCGMQFAVPEHWDQERRRKHDGWWCPNGHSLVYKGKSDAEKAREERDRYKEWLRQEEERLAAERRSHSATKGQLTKTRKRIAGGVCPCCNRTFQNLGRHMHTKHPDFQEQP